MLDSLKMIKLLITQSAKIYKIVHKNNIRRNMNSIFLILSYTIFLKVFREFSGVFYFLTKY